MGIYTDYNKIRGLRILDKDTDKLLHETITEDNCYLSKKDIDTIIASIKKLIHMYLYRGVLQSRMCNIVIYVDAVFSN
jgi:hypothetical protein